MGDENAESCVKGLASESSLKERKDSGSIHFKSPDTADSETTSDSKEREASALDTLESKLKRSLDKSHSSGQTDSHAHRLGF